MLFLRQLQHLLPNGQAWRTTLVTKTLRLLLNGLASVHESIRDFADLVYLDLFPETTRELDRWEAQFGLVAASTEGSRRQQLDGAWKATGGQSPSYLQTVVRAAGFDVYIHEWWYYVGPTRTTRNPRDYTSDPLLGTTQCGEALAQCGETHAVCNRFLANDTHYLVNRDLSQNAPPPVPTDPDRWPYFLYWGGEVFGTYADVPAARRAEFERLLLKLKPSHVWLVTLINYV